MLGLGRQESSPEEHTNPAPEEMRLYTVFFLPSDNKPDVLCNTEEDARTIMEDEGGIGYMEHVYTCTQYRVKELRL